MTTHEFKIAFLWMLLVTSILILPLALFSFHLGFETRNDVGWDRMIFMYSILYLFVNLSAIVSSIVLLGKQNYFSKFLILVCTTTFTMTIILPMYIAIQMLCGAGWL